MDCRRVVKVGGYSLSKDDPAIFKEVGFLTQDRAFPQEKYPKDTSQPVASTSGASTSASTEPSVDKQQSIQALARMHTELLKMARQLGCADLCSVDKASRVENVLAGITKKDLSCKYCKKTMSSVTNLKNHIRGQHLHKTAHFCAQCRKYFSEATGLKRHMLIHDDTNPKHKCPRCDKEFPTPSRLADHMPVHSTAKLYLCQFCKQKSFKRPKALKPHEEECLANPNRKARKQCRLCPKDFKNDLLLKRHFKSAHPGEDPYL